MGEVGLTKKIPPKTPISSLSGGERQAVAIARAMYFDSELIILDEPTNNLGVAETQGVLRFVRNARDSGHSCIFIAHNIHHVFQVVDRIVVLRRGRVVADDIDPKKTTIEQVEKVITGDLEFIGGEMTPSSGALAAAAAVVGEPPPTQSPDGGLGMTPVSLPPRPELGRARGCSGQVLAWPTLPLMDRAPSTRISWPVM